MINVKDAPYSAKGDGVTDDTGALQKAINDAGSGGVVIVPAGIYRTTSTLTIGYYPGLVIRGESWLGTTIRMDTDNKPLLLFTAQDTHSVSIEEMTLTYSRQQTPSQPNGVAVQYTNATSNSNGIYHHVYRKLRVLNANYAFQISSSGQLPVWGCKWEDIYIGSVGTTAFYVRSGKDIGKPMNLFTNIKIFQTEGLVASYAFDMQTEFLLDGLDIEKWSNGILRVDSGYNCTIRYVHVEHHVITVPYCTLFVMESGSYEVSAMDVSIKSWVNSVHTLLQGNTTSVLHARNIRANPEASVGAGSISLIGTHMKAVVAGLQKGNQPDLVFDYTNYLNNVWFIYSIDGLPPSIEENYSLPPASAAYRGRMFYKQNSKTSDALYVCIKDSTNKYVWKAVTVS